MRYLTLAAILLSTAAFAEDAPQPPAEATSAPAAAPAPTPPEPAKLAPAAPQLTEWYLKVDQAMINSIATCAQEMRKREADPFLFALDAQLKSQPALIAAIKAKP